VPTPDEERFEAYLKQFRPLAADPRKGTIAVRGRRWLLAGVCAAAVVAGMALVGLHPRPAEVSHMPNDQQLVKREIPRATQPLTLGAANALLSKSPSFHAAIDELAHQPASEDSSAERNSALAVLSQEESKL
jgi:hypothetical protein